MALQECPSAEALAQLGTKYVFVGASAAHAGFVHVYARRGLGLERVAGAPGPGPVAVMTVAGRSLALVAPHLPSAELGGAESRRETLRKMVIAAPSS